MATKAKKSDPTPAQLTGHGQEGFDAAEWERNNVHDVYSSIASHFSATRYKPWPLVSSFLASLPAGSIGVDVGCGNGKYLPLRNALHPEAGEEQQRNDCLTIGLDRSRELVSFAQSQTLARMSDPSSSSSSSSSDGSSSSSLPPSTWLNEVTVADGLAPHFRAHAFDYAISIATVHHFSTRERRREAVKEIVRLVKPRPPCEEDDNNEQDGGAAVPASEMSQGRRRSGRGRGRFLIYVWALEQRGQERRKFDEQDARRRAEEQAAATEGQKADGRDVMVPWVLKSGAKPKLDDGQEEQQGGEVYQRYYHLFEATELEALVEEAVADMSGIAVRREDSGWERGNWWGVWQVVDAMASSQASNSA